MPSRPATDRQLGSNPPSSASRQQQPGHPFRQDHTDAGAPFVSESVSTPPIPPTNYEIPSLRSRTARQNSGTTLEDSRGSASQSLQNIISGRKDQKHGQRQYNDLDASRSDTQSKSRFTHLKAAVSRSRVNLAAEPQLATGKCMTCGSTVRWPQDLKAFRCTTCLTVNDLEPMQENHDWNVSCRKPISISVETTKKLIHQCLDRYLRQQVQFVAGHEPSPAPRVNINHGSSDLSNGPQPALHLPHVSTPSTPNSPQNYAVPSTSMLQPSVSLKQKSAAGTGGSNDNHSARTRPQNMQEQSSVRSDPIGPTSISVVSIFRDVEIYISSSFQGCTALNASFFSSVSASSVSNSPATPQEPTMYDSSKPMVARSTAASISELDAKTLLLGDFVENGSWWTGKAAARDGRITSERDQSPEHWKGIVSAKTPRINWHELSEWYRIIMHAGNDWEARWAALADDRVHTVISSLDSDRANHMRTTISDSRLHLQRVLLKSTENLLKRPRRPLKSPEDCRFLLILLSNPQLTASARSLRTRQIVEQSQAVMHRSSSNKSKHNGDLGHHNGIIKRILGILSNLPNDVHKFFVSWLSRSSDKHFQGLVEMVSSFITYRLSKQQHRRATGAVDPTENLIPCLSNTGESHASLLHAAIGSQTSDKTKKRGDGKPQLGAYSEDWQVRAAARVMALLFQANTGHNVRKRQVSIPQEQRLWSAGLNAKYHAYSHGQILPISVFYNTLLDHADLVGDFEAWETTKTKFTFCQYPFFLSIWAKIRIMEYDARRQMEVKAREAFFDSILSRRAISQFLVLKVRRDCLVDDSLRSVSHVVGSGSSDIKKGLRIDFVGEEGVDAGGLRKEWFLLLVREIFDPQHGLFLYDEDSHYCYFNPFCFESSEQFFLVGVLLGLAIYNSTILDIAFPPFVFKKMLASAPPSGGDKLTSTAKITHTCTLDDLAEYRPALARGLRQLLEFEGNVQETFCRDFVVEMDKYGENIQIPLRTNGENKPVTNANRREFVDLYVRYLLDTAVARQYEPFKRGFFSVCGGNALSLFQPEEIELLVRGSDEPLDVASLRAVAMYDNWPKDAGPPDQQLQVIWFWESFQRAEPSNQRRLLSFITGSDRIPAMGTTNLTITVQCVRDHEAEGSGEEIRRFPTAHTCFNTINLHRYLARETLEMKLWTAVSDSEGFGLK